MKRIFFCIMILAMNLLGATYSVSDFNLAIYNSADAMYNNGLVSVYSPGDDFWNVQLTKNNIQLNSGKKYQVKFTLQGFGPRRVINVRVARSGFPYDAFGEFGEIGVLQDSRTITRTFTMKNENVFNARLEFNVGKYVGNILVSDVSLECLDCHETDANEKTEELVQSFGGQNEGYLISANKVRFGNYTKTLGGDVFGDTLELNTDVKIYGNVESGSTCFLAERVAIEGELTFSNSCVEQNNVSVKSRKNSVVNRKQLAPVHIVPGVEILAHGPDSDVEVYPGSYGSFNIGDRSTIRFSTGVYNFQNMFFGTDTKVYVDLNNGPVVFNVANGVNIADRVVFNVVGGNATEVKWNLSSGDLFVGTDGKFFGDIFAPNSFVRIASRTNVIGTVWANEFDMEPQSTVSVPPQLQEISHSHEHFAPYFNKGVYRYASVLPATQENVEMFIYGSEGYDVKVNDDDERVVSLPQSRNKVVVKISRNLVADFPSEAMSANYVFDFVKNANYRIYWNPSSGCAMNCDGSSPATPLIDFNKAEQLAQSTGRELVMTGGAWDVSQNFREGIVPWKVGFEMVGYEGEIWELSSLLAFPTINLNLQNHIEIEGLSPRSIKGFAIMNGFNESDGGAVAARKTQKLRLETVILNGNESSQNGGAVYAVDTLLAFKVRLANNSAKNGGAAYVGSVGNFTNVTFVKNEASENGGALVGAGYGLYCANNIFYGNEAEKNGGAIQNNTGFVNAFNSTFFANKAGENNGAISGRGLGILANDIFWKNSETEVVDGYTARNSSFSKAYEGTNNYVGDPLFLDESNPEGSNMFMDYAAGLNLSAVSPLVNRGVMEEGVPLFDIMEGGRPEVEFQLGPYGWTMNNGGEIIGYYDSKTDQVYKVNPVIPRINSISTEWLRNYLANSNYARTFKLLVSKHSKTNKSKFDVKVSLIDKNKKKYSDVPSIKMTFYKNGEENGRYVFQTRRSGEGLPILFSKNLSDMNVYSDVIILYVRNDDDGFVFEID